MLYEDLTTGAVISGRMLNFEFDSLTGTGAEAIEQTLKELNKQYGTDIGMYVPGDSATIGSVEEPLYTSCLLFGVPAAMGHPWDCPIKVSPQLLKSAQEIIDRVPEVFWKKLEERAALTTGFDADTPQTYLCCWGPLPQAVLSAGVPHPSAKRDETVYDFKSVQDMDQQWLEIGVDGVTIVCVEYSEVQTVDLSPDAVEGWLEKASKLKNSAIYMTLRYD